MAAVIIDQCEIVLMLREGAKSESEEDSERSSGGSGEEEAAAHACSYCGLQNRDCVVRCGNKTCGKWFCNQKGEGGFASHAVFHLVKAKHNELATHPEGEFGGLAIECFVCGNSNVFVLGFVEVRDGGESSVIFVCRAPCVTDRKSTEFEWNPERWEPIIQQKELVSWIAQKAGPEDKSSEYSVQEMMRLEEAWKSNPRLRANEVFRKRAVRRLRPVLLKYKQGRHYKAIFEGLLTEESKTDRRIKESQTQNNMKITFSTLSGKRYAYFLFGSREDYDASLLPGNELRVSYGNQWSSKGVVVKITGNEEVCLELFGHEPAPKEDYPYKVEFVWKPTSYHRMKKGLRRFENDHTSISSFLYHSVLGQPWPKTHLDIRPPPDLAVPGLPALNFYQLEAVRRALVEPLCLIQGPPGTGKTVTSASIVYHLVQQTKRQVLVCAPSNVVVDMLAQRIHQTGVKVLRFCSKSRESVSSDVEELTLHHQLRHAPTSTSNNLAEFYRMLDEERQLSSEQESRFKQLRKEAEYEIIKGAEVVCCTCIASADRRLSEFYFSHVLIDEATQAIEPECLLPMVKGAKQVILVGDHLQLGPVVICRDTARAGLNKCLFERLVLIGHRPLRLQVQYRMHPRLTYFPSNTFYDGTLQNGITHHHRALNRDFPWPNQQPSFFLNLYGTEELSASGTSYLNRTEAAAVDKVVFYLERAGVKGRQIGVITPYKGQRAYIINYLQKNGQITAKSPNYYKEIEIASVDGYQGREKDYIIVSCVRSNEGGPGIGFLKDPRRLNVTITRARYGMIVLGNAKMLYQDPLWNNLLNHYKASETLVEGNIPNFRPTLLSFPPPQKYTGERREPFQEDKEGQDDDKLLQEAAFHPFLEEVPITSGLRHSVIDSGVMPAVEDPYELFSSKTGTPLKDYV